MSVIARCEYGKTCSLLVQLFNNAAQAYQEMISNMGTSKMDISIQEGAMRHVLMRHASRFEASQFLMRQLFSAIFGEKKLKFFN
jgi:hypothetical protein